tara:strand:+ start:1684 stop:2175 length:492 start_codon:yes stop_codon:yes gene_type:complete
MKITKEELKQIVKEELGSVLEKAKKTPKWSSDYPQSRARRNRERSGKSAHGHGEDPFSSPVRFVKGKLGMPRDKIEKFRRDHNLTAGGIITDKALSFALYSGPRANNFKKTMKAIEKDQRRVISSLEDLSREEATTSDAREIFGQTTARHRYLDIIDRIISGE